LEAVGFGHKEVAQDQVRPVFEGESNAGLAIAGFKNVPIVPPKKSRGGAPAFGVILN
jgi:hypothetical protein